MKRLNLLKTTKKRCGSKRREECAPVMQPCVILCKTPMAQCQSISQTRDCKRYPDKSIIPKRKVRESRLVSLSATASDAGAKPMLCPYSRYNSENGVSNELADSTSSGIHFLRYRRSKTLQADTFFEKEHSHDRNMFLVMNRLKRVPHSLIALPGSLLPGGK